MNAGEYKRKPAAGEYGKKKNKRIQENTREHRGIQEYTGECKRI